MISSNRKNHFHKNNEQKSNNQLSPVGTYYDPSKFSWQKTSTSYVPWEPPVYPLAIDVTMGANSVQPGSNNVQKRQVLVAATEGDDSSARKRSRMEEDDASSSATKIHESDHRQTSDSIQTTTLATQQWFDEFTANKPTTPRPISATGTQMATLEEEMTSLKQDMRKLQDQLQSQEKILQSRDDTIRMFDKIMGHMAERIMALEKQTQA